MSFEKVAIETWPRRAYFDHYFSDVPCTYSMSVKLDITEIVASKRKLYPTMLYALTTIVNRHEEFRTAIDKDGNVGVYSDMYPCYTVFHKDTETFSNIWTQYNKEYSVFLAAYEDDIRRYGSVEALNAKPEEPVNTFPVSMIPWESFDGFNLNLQNGYDYLLPIFTLGKYLRENERCTIPLAVQVHHAVSDGFHVCRFINELRELLKTI